MSVCLVSIHMFEFLLFEYKINKHTSKKIPGMRPLNNTKRKPFPVLTILSSRGGVRYVKFSVKGLDFYKRKVKTLALARRKNFIQYLKEDRLQDPNFEKGNTDAWDQLVLSLSGVQFDLIQESDENERKTSKYEVLEGKLESLTDVTTME